MKEKDVIIIMNLFESIDDKIDKSTKKYLANLEYERLTVAEARAIYAIGEGEPKTMKQIAETLGVAISTPTATIDKLVDKGLVIRHMGVEDRRQLLIELTDKAKKILRDMYEAYMEETRRLLQPLSEKEISLLKDMLAKIDHKY